MQDIDGATQLGERTRHRFGQHFGRQARQTLAQPLDQREQLPDIGRDLAFRTLRETVVGMLLLLRAQALDEQAWLSHHALAGGSRAGLVMLEPGLQFARGQRRCRQRREQLARLRAVGARQRGQNSRCRPGGDRALAHGGEDAVGQATDEFQTAADPTHITTAAPRHLALGQALAMHEFLQQQRFFERHKGTSAGLREDRQQGLGEFAIPGDHLRGVAPESMQGLDTSVAIDQDQSLAVGVRNGDAGDELSALFDRTSQRFNGAGFDQARIRETQFKAVQIDFGGFGVLGGGIHGRHATRRMDR